MRSNDIILAEDDHRKKDLVYDAIINFEGEFYKKAVFRKVVKRSGKVISKRYVREVIDDLEDKGVVKQTGKKEIKGVMVPFYKLTNSNKQFYTIGYEKRDIQDYIEKLEENDVETLIDVRELPLSRKKGFSKTPLKNACQDAGIKYRHISELGAPKDIRDPLKDDKKDFEWFKRQYKNEIKDKDDYIDYLTKWAGHENIALTCYERDNEECHRNIVAEKMRERKNLNVIHI